MKKITKKLSMKYEKLHKSRLRQEGSMKSEEDGSELFRETHPRENEESNETKETPKVTKIMESMHRKLTLKEKAYKKNTHMDGYDQTEMSERSVRNGGRDRKDQLEGSVRNRNNDGMDQQVEGSVRTSHMDHLEDLIRGHRADQSEGSIRKGVHGHVDHQEDSSKNGHESNQHEDIAPKTSDQVDKSEGLTTRNPSDFASKKDYLDWIEYVEGSNHHCFDRTEVSERSYKKDDIDQDQISVGVSEGSVEGNNDDIILLKSSKYNKNEKFEGSKGYKKGKGSKIKDSFKSQMVD